MARPREFDEAIALDGAIEIFWRRGYAGTKLPDLLAAMGLSRGSFYAGFKDKHRAFLAAFERYEKVRLQALLDQISQPGPATLVDRIIPLFEVIETEGPLVERRGCFICNVMVELGPGHPEIALAAARMAKAIENVLFDALLSAGRSRENAKAQAETLVQLYLGAQALSKIGGGVVDFRQAIKSIIGYRNVQLI